MDLKILIQSTTMKEQGNYFLLVQLDELQYSEKEKKSQKFRSEVQFDCSNPKFKKNVFNFCDLSYGNRMTLKIGCFKTRLLQEPQDNRKLLDHSIIIGSMQLVLTVKILDALRIEGELKHESLLYDGSQDVGRLIILLRHKSHDVKAQVEDDVEHIQQIYYDPFEQDDEIISKKMMKVKMRLIELNEKLDPIQKKANFMRTAHKNVSYDLANLRKQKEELEKENEELARMVDKKNDVKELHIQIVLLCNTDQGQGMLKKKMVLLLNKLEFERKLYHELSNYYYSIEGEHNTAKSRAKELQTVKETLNEQEFLIKRMEDQMPLLKSQKEVMSNQESIIVTLQETIRESSKNLSKLDKQDLYYQLDKLRSDKILLEQKQKQLQYVQEINKGEVPRSFFEQFKNDEFFKDNPIILGKYQQRAEMLMKELELLQQELSTVKQAPTTYRPQTQETQLIQLEIEQADNKAEILQEQLLAVAKNYAKQIAELKSQLNVIEAQLSLQN